MRVTDWGVEFNIATRLDFNTGGWLWNSAHNNAFADPNVISRVHTLIGINGQFASSIGLLRRYLEILARDEGHRSFSIDPDVVFDHQGVLSVQYHIG